MIAPEAVLPAHRVRAEAVPTQRRDGRLGLATVLVVTTAARRGLDQLGLDQLGLGRVGLARPG
jgi:hypothetical protein